jgi:uncharacterized OB-fold protein
MYVKTFLMTNLRPLPQVTDETEAFWTGGEVGELRIYRCGECRTWFHPPAPLCPDCLSFEVGPEVTSGRARVAAFTINHQQWMPDLEVPYVVAIVELDDQPDVRLMTQVIDCEPENVSTDMAVEVTFEHLEDVWIPLFRPTDTTEGQG